jgi:hypothetical protein
MCGVDQALIYRMAQGWSLPELKPREAKIQAILREQGLTCSEPYIRVMQNGVPHYAYPDLVCMAVLEYYAFDPSSPVRDQASQKYRLLARRSFRDFIYGQLGYSPHSAVPIQWRQYLDRVTLMHDKVPDGYFCVFKEVANIVVTLISHGAKIDHRFVPDISVGNTWGRLWKAEGMDERFGTRETFDHNYPEYFPQAASNPQPIFCYPDAALGEFRRWMREDYLQQKFPAYVAAKIKDGGLPPSFSDAAFKAFGLRPRQSALTARPMITLVPPAANTRRSPRSDGTP